MGELGIHTHVEALDWALGGLNIGPAVFGGGAAFKADFDQDGEVWEVGVIAIMVGALPKAPMGDKARLLQVFAEGIEGGLEGRDVRALFEIEGTEHGMWTWHWLENLDVAAVGDRFA